MISRRPEGEPKRFLFDLLEIGRDPHATIMRELAVSPRRYNDLLGTVAITEAALGASLRELDADGFVRRRVEPGPPLRVFYELTDTGRELAPSLAVIEAWARGREG